MTPFLHHPLVRFAGIETREAMMLSGGSAARALLNLGTKRFEECDPDA
jgi:hypothetical protein